MKKLLSIMTMLVLMLGVTLNANAQVPIYTNYDGNDISDWTFSSIALVTVPPIKPNTGGYFKFVQGGDVFLEQGFIQIADMSSINISYSVRESTPFTYNDINFEVFLSKDNGSNWTSVHTYSGAMVTPVIDNFSVTNSLLFANIGQPTLVRIKISTAYPYILFTQLDDFSITGIQSTTGINENDLSDLNVYSYNKSVYISSNNNIDANVSVYNLSGQVVKTKNMNLSSSKSKVDLNDLTAGMYIVAINDGVSLSRDKVFIH